MLACFYLGQLARASDDLATARSFLEQAFAACQSAGSQGGAGCALRDLARVTAEREDAAQAAARYADVLAILHAHHDWSALVECFDGIAELDIDQGRIDRVRLVGVTAAMGDSMGARRSPYDEPRLDNLLTRLRGSAGGRFGAEWEIGGGLPVDGAVETAMVIVSSAAGVDAGPRIGQSKRSLSEPYGLSGRELEVLKLVAARLTNAEIAERLYLSPRTIDAHLRRIYPKMEVSSRGAAIPRAVEDGLV